MVDSEALPGEAHISSGDAGRSRGLEGEDPGFQTLVPFGLPFAVAFRDVAVTKASTEQLSPLLAGEATRVANAVEKRQREYRAGRHVARQALADLGYSPAPLVADDDGLPVAPKGVRLSLSHTGATTTYAAAVAARAARYLGLDVEELNRLSPAIVSRIASQAEEQELSPELGEASWAVTCFSCKEAVYKCIFPHIRRMIGFHDVRLSFKETGALVAVVDADGITAVDVRYAIAHGRVLSLAYVRT